MKFHKNQSNHRSTDKENKVKQVRGELSGDCAGRTEQLWCGRSGHLCVNSGVEQWREFQATLIRIPLEHSFKTIILVCVHYKWLNRIPSWRKQSMWKERQMTMANSKHWKQFRSPPTPPHPSMPGVGGRPGTVVIRGGEPSLIPTSCSTLSLVPHQGSATEPTLFAQV